MIYASTTTLAPGTPKTDFMYYGIISTTFNILFEHFRVQNNQI